MHFRRIDCSTRSERYSRKLRTPQGWIVFGQYVRITTRRERCSVFCDRERAQNVTDTDESPRASAVPNRLSCRGYCTALQFASFLASWFAIEPLDWPTFSPTPVYGYVRTQAAPYPENTSAQIQKAGPIGVFTTVLDDAGSDDASRGHGTVMTCCRVIDCPEKHVCAAGTLQSRASCPSFFS